MNANVNETVRQPRAARPETCRMFGNPILEKLSRIHPATPFVVYIPMMVVMLYRSCMRHDVSILGMAGMYVAGSFFWTLTEYFLHRYVFHWYRDTPFGRRAHFLLHGVHHDYPNDKDRLVMPLLTSAPLAVIFYTVFYFALGGVRLVEPFYAGFALGYLCYDGTHYAVHAFKQTTRVGKYLRRHHMLHHHADHEGGFGVSTPLWDLVFRTMPQVKRLEAKRSTPPGA